jgi:hypothetical protein
VGFTPQLVDLDGDGNLDVLSGSWPGPLYFFRRDSDGSFAAGECLKDKDGEVINLGSASTAFAVDWDSDQDLDLLVGSINGKVNFVPNESGGKELAFCEPVELLSLSEKDLGDSHPVAADWDGDGKVDLLVAHSEGGVLLSRNVGSAEQPDLSRPVELIPNSPSPWSSGSFRQPSDWGVRAKICVVDWNHDGLLDILLGDYCGRFTAKPEQTPEQLAMERSALGRLPQVRNSWATAYREYRRLLADKSEGANAEREKQAKDLLDAMLAAKEEIARCQKVQEEFQPQRQAHGFVWLFLRQASTEEKP